MTWFMKPCVTELKALTRQFRNCFSCFSQQQQQVSLSHTSVRLYIFNKRLNASMLDASLSETIVQIANYNKGTKQRQRKAIPSAHLKWVPGYLIANFYDTEQKQYNKNSFRPIRSELIWKRISKLSHKGIVNPNVPTRAVQEPLERKALQSVWIAQLRWKRYTKGDRKNQDTSCTMVPEVCNNSTGHIEGYEAKEPSRLAL